MNPHLHLAADRAAEEIENYIERFQLRPHDRLPSERELASLFHINRITLREALRRLENEHVLYSVAGSGTYLAPAKLRSSIGIKFSFSEYCAANGYDSSSLLLDFYRTEAGQYLSSKLHIPADAGVFILRRLRCFNGKPAAVETAHIPEFICPRLDEFHFDAHTSLYAIFTRSYSLYPQNAGYSISMTLADTETASLLNLEKNSPLLTFDVLSTTEDGRIMEYCQSIRRMDLFGFRTDILPSS